MTTITVPIDEKLNKYINSEVKAGRFASKAFFVREAIIKYKEELLVQEILQASREKSLRGDLDDLAKLF